MSVQDLTDYEYAHKRLSYDPDTGLFIWREAGPEFFKTHGSFVRWNNRYAGSIAGAKRPNGYRQFSVKRFGKIAMTLEHCVAWLMVHGDWPSGELDHINGVVDDNRICNLRDVDRATNMQNRAMHSNNKSGVCGVNFRKNDNLWYASIKVYGEKRIQKSFKSFEEAIAYRKYLENEYGCFTNRHGMVSDVGKPE